MNALTNLVFLVSRSNLAKHLFHSRYSLHGLAIISVSSDLCSLATLLCHDMCPLIYLFAIVTVVPSTIIDATPLVIPWNTTHSYGPDGPWPVITVQVGSSNAADTQPLSTIDLYPGGIWDSMLLRHLFCNDNGTVSSDGSSDCLAEKAGLYYVAESETVRQNFTDQVSLVWEWASNMATGVSGSAVHMLDTIRIPSLNGTFAIHDSSISAVQAWQIELPDGTYYSAQVGSLSLGGPGTGIETFSANANGQTVPGYAYAQGVLDSNSWGLHYGSASLDQEGSLVFGGYDQSRVLGDVGAFTLGLTPNSNLLMMPDLLDIQIGVESGSSPFSESFYSGLLKLNASFNGTQPTVINPIVPYLFMSPETCAAVVENLPVVLNSQVGLYIWNTTDPQYEIIIKSPAYLAFIFQKAGNGNLTIKVPFRLLNLTLEEPIITTTQQYFPCRPFHALDNSGHYFLGKAFLQAAFIGMNWQKEMFFLAQAPGPGVGASNIRPIGPNDNMINADPIENFGLTWARGWTELPNTDGRNSTQLLPTSGAKGTSDTGNSKNLTANQPGANIDQNGTSDSGMSRRAKVDIGVVVGAIVVAGVMLLFFLRRSRIAVSPQDKVVVEEQGEWVHDKDGEAQDPDFSEDLPHEVDNDHERYELELRPSSPQKGHNDSKIYEVGDGLPHEADNDYKIHELG